MHSLSRLLEDCHDLTVTPDERGDIGPQIAFQVKRGEGQENPTSEASTSGVVIDGSGHGDKPMGKCS